MFSMAILELLYCGTTGLDQLNFFPNDVDLVWGSFLMSWALVYCRKENLESVIELQTDLDLNPAMIYADI